MSSSTSPRAFTSVSQNPDILPLILSHLPNASLFDCLLTSSTFFHAAAPILYRTLTIRDQADLFIGSTRSGASPSSSSFFSPIDNSPSLSPASRPSPYSKNHSLSYVREVHLFTHGKNQCPFVRHYINPLPHLQLLHLARGPWPTGLDTPDACNPATCPFIAKACCTARRVLVRDANLAPLIPLSNLESVALKLRPCQLPMYLFHEAKYTWPWQLPPLGRARVLDLIFWDERHAFRVDWHEVPGGGVGFMGGVGRLRAIPAGERQTTRLKGCTFCDERGCIRHSPHAPVQLPALAYALGRETGVRELRVWNGERSAEKQWGREGGMSAQKVLLLMKQEFLAGKRERYTAQHESGTTGEAADKMSDVVVTFHSADEYYASPARWNGEMDEEEEEYWQLRVEPSPRLLELRREASELMGLDETMFRRLGAEELEKYIEDERMIQKGGLLE